MWPRCCLSFPQKTHFPCLYTHWLYSYPVHLLYQYSISHCTLQGTFIYFSGVTPEIYLKRRFTKFHFLQDISCNGRNVYKVASWTQINIMCFFFLISIWCNGNTICQMIWNYLWDCERWFPTSFSLLARLCTITSFCTFVFIQWKFTLRCHMFSLYSVFITEDLHMVVLTQLHVIRSKHGFSIS